MLIAAAVVFAGFAFVPLHDGIWQVALLLFPIALVFGVTGVVFLRIAKRKEQLETA